MSVIKSSEYKNGIKWKLNTKSKIDSVASEVLDNTVTETVLASDENILNVIIDNTSVPLSSIYDHSVNPAVDALHFYKVNGKEVTGGVVYEKVKGRIDVVFGIYEKTFTLSSPMTDNNITVEIERVMKTRSIGRAAAGYTTYPDSSYLKNKNYDLAGWIKNYYGTVAEDGSKWLYGDYTPFNPFMRRPYPAVDNLTQQQILGAMPPTTEVLTRWYTGNKQFPVTGTVGTWNAGIVSGVGKVGNDFDTIDDSFNMVDTFYSSFNMFSSQNTARYWQDVEYEDDTAQGHSLTPYRCYRCIRMRNYSITPYVKYTINSNISVTVKIIMPIKIAYAAASQARTGILHNNQQLVDSYAFVDYLSRFNVIIKGMSFGDNTNNYLYDLDSNDNLEAIGSKTEFNYVIEKNPFLTESSYYNSTKLYQKISKDILDAYKIGKMTIECTVNADDKHQINNCYVIEDKYGQVINKNNTAIIFQLKNITKKYEQGNYTYDLGLLEASDRLLVEVKIYSQSGSYDLSETFKDNTDMYRVMEGDRSDVTNILELRAYGKYSLSIEDHYFDASNLQSPTDMSIEYLDVSYNNGANIGNYAFYYCYNLKYVNINNCTLIGNYAFAEIGRIDNLYLNTTTDLGASYIFNNTTINKVWFKGTENQWNTFINNVGEGSDPYSLYTEIYVFENNKWRKLERTTWPITDNVSNGQLDKSVANVSGNTTIQITPSANFTYPSGISVYGATYVSYSTVNGTLIIKDAVGPVTISGSCVRTAWPITDSVSNGFLDVSAASISGTTTIHIIPYTGYSYPTSVSVTGATYIAYDPSTGALGIQNPTGNVTISGSCPVIPSGYQVTVTADGSQSSYGWQGLYVYDGDIMNNPGGCTLLDELDDGDVETFNITTGFISFVALSGIVSTMNYSSNLIHWDDSSAEDVYKVLGDGTATVMTDACFAKGTLITMADHSVKKIEDVTIDDELLVFNFYTGEQSKAKPLWIHPEKISSYHWLIKFSNGTELKLIGPESHRLFNLRTQSFDYAINFNEGDEVLLDDGTITKFKSFELVREQTSYYNLITKKHYNCYINHILSSCRLSNAFSIENMRYNTDKRLMSNKDIINYKKHLKQIN